MASNPLPTELVSEKTFLIYYHSDGDLAVWWCPNGEGYTTNIAEAGLYSRRDAEIYCRGRDQRNHMVDPDALVAVRRTIVQVDKDYVEALLNGE